MANEAQASQAHRAELDFDINGLKEKIETLDQGGEISNSKRTFSDFNYLLFGPAEVPGIP